MTRKKGSKAERRAQRKLEKKLAELQKSSQLPASVAQNPSLPDTLSFLDGSNYQLIFERYNHKECELSSLNPTTSRALVNKLSAITKFNSKTIKSASLIRDKVENDGNYASLYEGLEVEIELVEIKFADDGRIFCYFVDDQPQNDNKISNYCCIIAIKTKHMRTR